MTEKGISKGTGENCTYKTRIEQNDDHKHMRKIQFRSSFKIIIRFSIIAVVATRCHSHNRSVSDSNPSGPSTGLCDLNTLQSLW